MENYSRLTTFQYGCIGELTYCANNLYVGEDESIEKYFLYLFSQADDSKFQV